MIRRTAAGAACVLAAVVLSTATAAPVRAADSVAAVVADQRAPTAAAGTAASGAATTENRWFVDGPSDPAPNADNTRPAALENVAIHQRLGEQVPLDLTFRDESGRAVALRDLVHDKPVILSLVYYECPMLCTLVLNGLVRTLNGLTFSAGKEFDVVTVSFNPNDTPELARAKKATYLGEYRRPSADAGWHFLTGDPPAIESLARSVGFQYTYVPEKKQFAHAAAIMVLTPEGKLARYYYGVEYSARDLRLGLVEAANHQIGNPVDELMLYCFAYDPMTGKYGMIAMRMLRVAGVATVLAIGGFIFVMWQRERRALHAPDAPASVDRTA